MIFGQFADMLSIVAVWIHFEIIYVHFRMTIEQQVLRKQTANQDCIDHTPGHEENPGRGLALCRSCFVTEMVHQSNLQAVSFLVFQAINIC